MNFKKITLLLAGAAVLSGCSTFSFAPPAVNVTNGVQNVDPNSCNPEKDTDYKFLDNRSMKGAIRLVDNFVFAYRCAHRGAANGRQFFQVPSFLGLALGASASVFGLSDNEALAAGIGSAALNGLGSYYVPREKASLIDSALDAILCIRNEAVGVSFFDTQQDPSQSRLTITDGAGQITIDPNLQYYQMVSTALFSVERVLAERLSSAGQADLSGIINQIEGLRTQADNDGDSNNLANQRLMNASNGVISAMVIENKTLHPRLQICVLRAKL